MAKKSILKKLKQAQAPAPIQPTLPRMQVIAKPAVTVNIERPLISFGMIAKDEEKGIEKCLRSVKDHVCEMIVVDTGSTDRTVEIAESLGAKVIRHEWKGDFSEARNIYLRLAKGHWILVLDADE
jgi:cellulose synthase/poly-beta-1,6-N-acetylglucosamine synthase-like glycosyltransferase